MASSGAVQPHCRTTGRFLPYAPSIERFARKCAFEPITGCVVWTGGTTSGRGDSKAVYGSFWDGGRRWFAHRWSAAFIHGHEITGLQVDHCCPHRAALGLKPNTLCVEHVQPEPAAVNRALQDERRRALQSNEQRQFWLFVSLGIEPAPSLPEPVADNDQIPFFTPPEWFLPFMATPELDQCPF